VTPFILDIWRTNLVDKFHSSASSNREMPLLELI